MRGSATGRNIVAQIRDSEILRSPRYAAGMQIDFHHATTYVLARCAGFAPDEAGVIAYSAQYVDDAVSDAPVRFSNGAMYSRSSSAHRMLDYRNFEALADHI